ncbi:hypothetical protein [Halocatena marina]|uniref:hypothetical protein n=1 Tax=Halocatena marina TaxID=2934937 RepID=UPI00222594A8|nr:hypothetical protein [Halocatena marina]
MAVSALIWISLTTLVSGLCMVAFVLHYVRANECDFMAFAVAVVFGGGSLELGMANGYLPESQLFTAIGGVCAIIAVVAGAISIQRQQRGFQIVRNDTE